ncbi:dicarboxylate/amino acid:cation symporter [Spirochaeta dissipatitropha]
MKLWMGYGAGILLGIFLGLWLPAGETAVYDVIAFFAELSLNIGQYMIVPLLFFLVPVSVFSLRQDRKLLRVVGKTMLLLVISSVAAVVLAVLIVLALSPQRVPIIMAEAAVTAVPDWQQILLRIFPENAAAAIEGSYLLPALVLSLFLGFGFTASHSFSEPVLDFFDSAARLMYTLNAWIVSFMSVLLVPLTAAFIMQMRVMDELHLFSELLFVIGFTVMILVLVLIPVLVYLLAQQRNPVHFLSAILPALLTAGISGNHMFALATLMRTGRNNQGISRKAESLVFSFTTIFLRAGTALVSMIAFIVILRSYSSLEISIAQVLAVGISAVGFSFILGAVPGADILVMLSILAGIHGRGINEGYLILLPVIPVLYRAGTILDVAFAAAIAQISAVSEHLCKFVPQHDFV